MGWIYGFMDVQVLTYCVKLFPKRKNDQSAYIMGCQKFFNKTGKKINECSKQVSKQGSHQSKFFRELGEGEMKARRKEKQSKE